MSGNEQEMPDGDGSTRLRDRARSSLERVRDLGEGAADRSTRLQDRARSAFAQRKQQAQQAKQAVEKKSDQFASALDLAPGQIEPVQLDDRGEEIGFVPTEAGQDELAMDFAEERPFVEPTEALVQADPREGVRTRVNPAAAEEIAGRARQDIAGDDPFAEPGDFDVDVGPGGVTDAGFTPIGERRRAGRQFAAETPLGEVGPNEIEQSGDGFSLTDPAERRLAAREFETELEQFGRGELDPGTDVQAVDDGFGLSRGPAREVAADRIDDQLPELDIGPSDIELEQTEGGRFTGSFEREVRR